MKGMVKNKPTLYPERKQLNNYTEKNKGQTTNTKRYIGKKKRTKTKDLRIEADTDFKGWCSDLGGYIFNI